MSRYLIAIGFSFVLLNINEGVPAGFTGLPTKLSKQIYLANLWPEKTVRYAIDDSVPREWLPYIQNSIEQFSNSTCVKWTLVPDDEKAIYQKYFRKIDAVMSSESFTNDEKQTKIDHINTDAKRKLGAHGEAGCVMIRPEVSYNSQCGFCNKGKHYTRFGQQLLIGTHNKECYKVAIAHEMMHCIGFSHELDRIDRDEYITVIDDEINKRQKTQFYSSDRGSILPYGQENITKFDFRSIMLVGPKNLYFVNPAKPDSEFAGTNSNTNQLSALDILKVNRLYGCVAEDTWLGTPN